jgi:hypothetical protein
MSRKITDEKKRAVRDLARTGRPQREIAEITCLSKGAVSSILRAPWRENVAARRAATHARIAPKLPTLPAPAPVSDVGARSAKDVLGELTEADRELVLAEVADIANEAVDARNAEIEAVLARIGAEQDSCPVCPTCGLQGSTSKLLVKP